MIKVLVSDDNTRLFDPWGERAIKYNIDLLCFSNWEEAQYELEEHWDEYAFIILDGQGKIQEEGVQANKKHLISAVQWLKEQLGNGKYKPALIYTGYYELIEEIAVKDSQVLEIFDKGKVSIDDVFQFILSQISKTPDKIIKGKYPDVFKVFEHNYLDKEVEKMLLDLLKMIDKSNGYDLKSCAILIRSIQEALYKSLNYYVPDILPDDCFKENGMVDFNKTKSLLSGKTKDEAGKIVTVKKRDLQGSDIENLSNTIYWVCGNIIHYSMDKKYEIGKYTLHSLVFGLLEQILWYKKLIDKKTSK
jgi:hypothetical protein